VVRRLPPYHVVDVRIRDMEGLEDESGLPEYPYYAAAYTLPSEKEERNPQKEEQPNRRESTEPSGNRLRRMMSFVRGTDP
jgi:hypothetical protein